jgi:hypothetical protein
MRPHNLIYTVLQDGDLLGLPADRPAEGGRASGPENAGCTKAGPGRAGPCSIGSSVTIAGQSLKIAAPTLGNRRGVLLVLLVEVLDESQIQVAGPAACVTQGRAATKGLGGLSFTFSGKLCTAVGSVFIVS